MNGDALIKIGKLYKRLERTKTKKRELKKDLALKTLEFQCSQEMVVDLAMDLAESERSLDNAIQKEHEMIMVEDMHQQEVAELEDELAEVQESYESLEVDYEHLRHTKNVLEAAVKEMIALQIKTAHAIFVHPQIAQSV